MPPPLDAIERLTLLLALVCDSLGNEAWMNPPKEQVQRSNLFLGTACTVSQWQIEWLEFGNKMKINSISVVNVAF